MYDENEERLAGLIGLGLGAGVAFAVAKLLMSSADSWAKSSLAATRHSNNSAILELATCSRCVEHLLVGRPTKKSKTNSSTPGIVEQLAALHLGD